MDSLNLIRSCLGTLYVRKVQETSQIRWLMYVKSAICKSGQFEFDCVNNWKPVNYHNIFAMPRGRHNHPVCVSDRSSGGTLTRSI